MNPYKIYLYIKGMYKQLSKTYKYYYPDGSLKEKVSLKNGIKDGPYESYYERKKGFVQFEGYIQSRGNFKNDLETGYWEYFRSDGLIKSSGNYTEGFLNGIWSFYDEDGIKFSEIEYKNDKRNGLFIEYYANKQVFKKGQFLNDMEDGIFKTYYQDDKNYKRFSPQNITDLIYEIILYEKGLIIGIKVFDEKGKLITEEGRDPEYFIGYDNEGNKISEGKLINDKKEGIWIFYKPKLKAIEYINSEIVKSIEYYDNTDIIKGIVEYIDNNVTIKCYDKDGNISRKIKYDKNNKKKRNITYYFYSVTRNFLTEDFNNYEIRVDKEKIYINDVDIEEPKDKLYDSIIKGKIGDEYVYTLKGKVKRNDIKSLDGSWEYSFNNIKYELRLYNNIPTKFVSWIKVNGEWIEYTDISLIEGIKSYVTTYIDEKYDRIFTVFNDDGTIKYKYGIIEYKRDHLNNFYIDDIIDIKGDDIIDYSEIYDLTKGNDYLKERGITYHDETGCVISKGYLRFSESEPFFISSYYFNVKNNEKFPKITINFVNSDGPYSDYYESYEDFTKDGLIIRSEDFTMEYDYKKNKLKIYVNDKTIKGEPIKMIYTIDPEFKIENFEFDENNLWKWFKNSYTVTEISNDSGSYMKYRIDKRGEKLIKTGSYDDNGMKNGRWEYYDYIKGEIIEEYGNYIRGLKDGIWKERRGDIITETLYSMGDVENVIQYSIEEEPPEYKSPVREDINNYYILPQI